MKKIVAMFLFALASTAFGSDGITLPAEGRASAESIIDCEAQVARMGTFEKAGDKTGTGYKQINAGSDSFVYLFTGPAEPAHPAMMKITIHPMADPRQPKDSDIEFFGAYAGREADFHAWSGRAVYDFGRGFGTAVKNDH